MPRIKAKAPLFAAADTAADDVALIAFHLRPPPASRKDDALPRDSSRSALLAALDAARLA